MTVRDIIYVAAAITEGENLSKQTMHAVYEWFQKIGLDLFFWHYVFLFRYYYSIKVGLADDHPL